MRISVMELGRFTATREVSGRAPELKLIILHGAGEGNGQSFKASRFQGFNVARFQGYKASNHDDDPGGFHFETVKPCSFETLLFGLLRRRCGSWFRLLGDDLVFDLVVSRLRNNLPAHQISLHFIWTPIHDFLRIRLRQFPAEHRVVPAWPN